MQSKSKKKKKEKEINDNVLVEHRSAREDNVITVTGANASII